MINLADLGKTYTDNIHGSNYNRQYCRLLALLFHLCPGIFEVHRQVEDGFFRG